MTLQVDAQEIVQAFVQQLAMEIVKGNAQMDALGHVLAAAVLAVPKIAQKLALATVLVLALALVYISVKVDAIRHAEKLAHISVKVLA